MLKLRDIRLQIDGKENPFPGQQWAKLNIRFIAGLAEDDTDHGVEASIALLVPERDEITWSELREAAASSAITILEAALDALKGPVAP